MLTPLSVSSITPPIVIDEVSNIAALSKQLQICSQIPFTGQLDLEIQSSQIQTWSLFFYRGGLVWADSETHPIRRWYRQLSQYCPQLLSHLTFNRTQFVAFDYLSLMRLVGQNNVPSPQVMNIVAGNITEILFDIIQAIQSVRMLQHRVEVKLIYRHLSSSFQRAVESRIITLQPEQVWQQAEKLWNDWEQTDLLNYSANLAPVIWKPEELQKQTSSVVYHNLSTLMDGDRTLRDLAVKLKQTPLNLVQSIRPYVQQELIGLVEVGDLLDSVQLMTATSTQPASLQPPAEPTLIQASHPLIAYIDDSQFDALTMSHILTQFNCRFINIQDPVQALPILLELKPSLIFLDLVMPNTNGYEVCTQIRRASTLKTVPVIIVTSSDGIIDRVRAKIVGSSGFLAKPITLGKIQKVLRRHLPVPLPI